MFQDRRHIDFEAQKEEGPSDAALGVVPGQLGAPVARSCVRTGHSGAATDAELAANHEAKMLTWWRHHIFA